MQNKQRAAKTKKCTAAALTSEATTSVGAAATTSVADVETPADAETTAADVEEVRAVATGFETAA